MKHIHSISSGFTLIELMITVAIVGILAAIAYPSYQDSVRKSWRANAVSCLTELAQGMERAVYRQFELCRYGSPALRDVRLKAAWVIATTFRFTADPTATAFTLQAVPDTIGPQASDTCGTLTLNQMGQKGSDSSVSECWRR